MAHYRCFLVYVLFSRYQLHANTEKIAVLKEQQEDLIEEALEEFGLNFPRLEILDHIYPSTKIRELVVRIYKEVVEFTRESAIYYQKSSMSELIL